MAVNNIKVVKDDDTFVETTVGTELNKKFMFGNNGINFQLPLRPHVPDRNA